MTQIIPQMRELRKQLTVEVGHRFEQTKDVIQVDRLVLEEQVLQGLTPKSSHRIT